MLLAIAYVWWYALSARRRPLIHIAAASLIGEGMLISVNGGDCPLGGVQEPLGEPVPLFKLVSRRVRQNGRRRRWTPSPPVRYLQAVSANCAFPEWTRGELDP